MIKRICLAFLPWIVSLLPLSAKAGAIVYDTICSNATYTIRGNMPDDTDVPHHFVWEVSSDGGATWTRVPNSNRQNLTLADFQVGMSDMSVQRRLYRRYFFSPHHVSESDIVGLVIAKGYRLSRTTDTITPCMDSKGFEITTPLPATFEWQCLESGKTLQPQTTTVTTSKYKVRVADLKTTDSEMPNGTYSLSLSIHQSGSCTDFQQMKVTVRNATVSPFNTRETDFNYNNQDALTINRSWGGVDRQQWTIPSEEIGNLTVESGAGILHGVSTTFMKDVVVDAVCADYPDQHYQIHFKERVRNFIYTGSPQMIYIPRGKFEMECWGAQGGSMAAGGYTGKGGRGGYTMGDLNLATPETFYVYVGGAGQGWNGSANHYGGWNGGGICYGGASGGGGATDIRMNGGSWNDAVGLRSRIMVAGGGGGSNDYQDGGYGGGVIGGIGMCSSGTTATGGTQTSGGTGWLNGAFGIGAGCENNYSDGGAGGGGYYGGGKASGCCCAGGGGSSFISGIVECNAVNVAGTHTGQPYHYSNYVFEDAFTDIGVRAGHGYARISYIDDAVDDDYKKIGSFGTFRAWRDGTYATSAEAYRRPTNGYKYRGHIGSGIYRIDPDGPSGPIQPFDVYCEMVLENGGWMLAGKFSNNDAKTWCANKAYWTNTSSFGNALDITTFADAKSQAWSNCKVDYMMFQTMRVPQKAFTTRTGTSGNTLREKMGQSAAVTLSQFFTSKLASFPNTSSGSCYATLNIRLVNAVVGDFPWINADGFQAGYISIGKCDGGDTQGVISGYSCGAGEADQGLGSLEDAVFNTGSSQSDVGAGGAGAADDHNVLLFIK